MKGFDNIVYFLDFPFCVGGSNKVLLTQAYIMRQKGYQVKVVIPNDIQKKHSEEYDRLCKQYALDTLTAYYNIAVCIEEIDIMAALEEYQAIIPILEEIRPDLIHSTQLNIAVELAARELKIPHLMNIYQVDEQAFNVGWMKIFPQYHSADSYIMSNRWSAGLGIPSKCIRVAYTAKGEEDYYFKENDETLIISIGALCERKNQLESIKFVLHCKKKGYFVKLVILGENQNVYGHKCKKYVDENELNNQVYFLGFVSEVEKYFRVASLFILSSTVESYPGVIVESMANRVPIISTPVAGVPELVKDEENGFLSKGYEAKDLYEAFLRYLNYRKSGEINLVIENAYNTYLDQHSFEKVGNELEKYYQWVIRDYLNKNTFCLTARQVTEELNRFIEDKKIDITQMQSNKIWLLYHILPIMEQKDNKKIIVWGAGEWGKIVFEWIETMKSQINFVGFIDSFKKGEYLGFPIVNRDDILVEECGTIIVAVVDENSRLEIINYLDVRGKERNKDYFLIWNGPIRI